MTVTSGPVFISHDPPVSFQPSFSPVIPVFVVFYFSLYLSHTFPPLPALALYL